MIRWYTRPGGGPCWASLSSLAWNLEEHEGVLFINPGSAGPRRFRLPIAVAKLYVADDSVRAEIVELKLPG